MHDAASNLYVFYSFTLEIHLNRDIQKVEYLKHAFTHEAIGMHIKTIVYIVQSVVQFFSLDNFFFGYYSMQHLSLNNEHLFSSGKARTSFMKNWIKNNIDWIVKQATSRKKNEQVYIQQASS